MEPRGSPSLRVRLTRHVLVALALVWGLGSAVLLTLGSHFAGEAFDRALLDDAHALAAHVRQAEGRPPRLDLTPREALLLRFDQREAVFFAVFDAQGGFAAGDPELAADAVPSGQDHVFSMTTLEDRALRRVSLRPGGDAAYTLVVAQTMDSRTQLLRRLLLYSGLVQLWLLVVLAFWLARGIGRELQPLADLQDAVDRRDAADLEPLPAPLAGDARTQDVQRLGEAVNALLTRVRHGLQAQREFAGTVAHELRTPLAGIRMQLAQALVQDELAQVRSELQGVAQAEQRASRTVDQLLALARADERGAVLVREPLALDVLVRDTVLRHLPRADALGVDLGAEGLEQPLSVLGHPLLVEGILDNLIDNALRYAATAHPRVTVSLQCDADGVCMAVTDNGPGLDGVEASALQQRWSQGEQGLRLGIGAGLGLAIVARYAALLGGRFVLQPAPGGTGLFAGVHLPILRNPPRA